MASHSQDSLFFLCASLYRWHKNISIYFSTFQLSLYSSFECFIVGDGDRGKKEKEQKLEGRVNAQQVTVYNILCLGIATFVLLWLPLLSKYTEIVPCLMHISPASVLFSISCVAKYNARDELLRMLDATYSPFCKRKRQVTSVC